MNPVSETCLRRETRGSFQSTSSPGYSQALLRLKRKKDTRRVFVMNRKEGIGSWTYSTRRTTCKATEPTAEEQDLCDLGDPDIELCDLEKEHAIKDDIFEESYLRGRWLLGLLVLQSSSSLVLDRYQDLLRDHLVVTLFLTMLVGAGGNAGNQSAIKVIRGLATKQMDGSIQTVTRVIKQQVLVGILLGIALAGVGFVRVYITNGDLNNAYAISLSLFIIVLTSTALGSSLPFVLYEFGVDPANAGTSIQVIMDILGVTITCFTCNLVLSQLANSIQGIH